MPTSPKKTPLDRAIDLAGGVTALATKLSELTGEEIKPNRISMWRERGVPAEMCRWIEKAVGGQVTRYELLPVVFGDGSDARIAA